MASVDGTTVGGQSLTLKAGSGNVTLGASGSTTRLDLLTDGSATTLDRLELRCQQHRSTFWCAAPRRRRHARHQRRQWSDLGWFGRWHNGRCGQSLTLKAGSGNVTLGASGSNTRLNSLTDGSATTLTGSSYDANSIAFGALTLADNVTLDTSVAISVGSVDGMTAGGQSLTLKSGSGHVTLGDTGATTRLGALNDSSATTMTGSTYDANSMTFSALTLADDVTLDTSAANGAITMASVEGTVAGSQSLTLKAGAVMLRSAMPARRRVWPR